MRAIPAVYTERIILPVEKANSRLGILASSKGAFVLSDEIAEHHTVSVVCRFEGLGLLNYGRAH